MPSKSRKQARFMAAVANNPKFAKKAGVSQAIGREFTDADRRIDMPSKYNSTANKPGKAVKKYRGGGRMGPRSQRPPRPPSQAALAARAAASTMPKPPMPSGGWGSGLHEGGDVDRRRDLRDEEGRVIREQDDHADELRRIKGDRGRNRDAERQRVGGEERDERDEMSRLRGKAAGLGMKKGGKVRGAGIAIKGVRPAKMIKMS